MDFTKQSPVILSLCPGMLGIERGFERASARLGWKRHTTAAYVEIEAFICWNLVKQMEQGVLAAAPVHTNIKTFNGDLFRGKVHGIFGGYPCQPFSLAGERKGTEDPRHLWPYISGIIKSIRPVFCFFENVSGHLSMGFDEVYRSLSDMGYRVEAGIFTAEEVGAPHERERLFILAIKMEYANFDTIQRREEFGRIRPEFIRTSEELANTFCEGWKRKWNNGISEGEKQPKFAGNGSDSWPAGPGQEQFEWEEPRLKSRMGFTINGYNFKEDLLRMAGNGVVEQTAEIAFIDILKKF